MLLGFFLRPLHPHFSVRAGNAEGVPLDNAVVPCSPRPKKNAGWWWSEASWFQCFCCLCGLSGRLNRSRSSAVADDIMLPDQSRQHARTARINYPPSSSRQILFGVARSTSSQSTFSSIRFLRTVRIGHCALLLFLGRCELRHRCSIQLLLFLSQQLFFQQLPIAFHAFLSATKMRW